MEQGMAQDLLGECVLGIVINYLQWSFFKSHEDYIELEDATLLIGTQHNFLKSGQQTKEGIEMIAGKIYSLLSDG